MLRELIEKNLALMTSGEAGGMLRHIGGQTWLFNSWHDCMATSANFLFQADDGKLVYFRNHRAEVPANVLAEAQSHPFHEGYFRIAEHPVTGKRAIVGVGLEAPPDGQGASKRSEAVLLICIAQYNKQYGFDPKAYAVEFPELATTRLM